MPRPLLPFPLRRGFSFRTYALLRSIHPGEGVTQGVRKSVSARYLTGLGCRAHNPKGTPVLGKEIKTAAHRPNDRRPEGTANAPPSRFYGHRPRTVKRSRLNGRPFLRVRHPHRDRRPPGAEAKLPLRRLHPPSQERPGAASVTFMTQTLHMVADRRGAYSRTHRPRAKKNASAELRRGCIYAEIDSSARPKTMTPEEAKARLKARLFGDSAS